MATNTLAIEKDKTRKTTNNAQDASTVKFYKQKFWVTLFTSSAPEYARRYSNYYNLNKVYKNIVITLLTRGPILDEIVLSSWCHAVLK